MTEELDEHPVIHTTRIQLTGDTTDERRGELTDAIRDIPVGGSDGPLCVCGSTAEDGPNRAHCHSCGDEFVPELCVICGRRAQLLSVDDRRMCQACVDEWGGNE